MEGRGLGGVPKVPQPDVAPPSTSPRARIENPWAIGDNVWTYSIIYPTLKVFGTIVRVRGEAVEIKPKGYTQESIFRQADKVWRDTT